MVTSMAGHILDADGCGRPFWMLIGRCGRTDGC